MIRLYDYVVRHLHCCACGCFIPLAAAIAIPGTVGTWMVLT